jgi:hypothetical protein
MIQATRTNTPTRPRMNRLNPGLLSQIQMPLPLASIEHSSPKFKCSAAPCPISLAPPLSPFYAPLRPVPPLPGPSPNGAGCAIPRSSGEQGNCAGSRGAWPRSPFAYPRTGNGGRRRGVAGLLLFPSELPTKLDSGVVGSGRAARFRARWGLFGPVT